jgi:hypothetical protein
MRFAIAVRRLTALIPVLTFACGIASAQTPERTVGTGANTSYFVIDFKDGSAAPSHLFSYQWDPVNGVAPTGAQMIDAFVAGVPGFSVQFTNFSFGRFYDAFTYGAQSRARPADFSQFWGYWTSTNGINWTGANEGATARLLSNGSWDGWSFGPNGGPAPVTPSAVSAAAPEPGTLALALFGGAAIGVIRRRRRRA